MEETLVHILSQGGAVGVAIFAVWMLHRELTQRASDIEQRMSQERDDKLLMMSVMREHNETLQGVKIALERLCGIVEKR